MKQLLFLLACFLAMPVAAQSTMQITIVVLAPVQDNEDYYRWDTASEKWIKTDSQEPANRRITRTAR